MSAALDDSLVARVVKKLGDPPRYTDERGPSPDAGVIRLGPSLLLASAMQFGRRPEQEGHTHPSGFDPRGAALFESIVESAYLVATADGHFDEREQRTLEHIVLTVCSEALTESQVAHFIRDVEERLQREGRSARMAAVLQAVATCGHAGEVLRVAVLMAEASGGVSAEEQAVLEELSRGLALEPHVLTEALGEVRDLHGPSRFGSDHLPCSR